MNVSREHVISAFEVHLEEARTLYQKGHMGLAYEQLGQCLALAGLLKRHHHNSAEDEERDQWVRHEMWVARLQAVVSNESPSPSSRTRR